MSKHSIGKAHQVAENEAEREEVCERPLGERERGKVRYHVTFGCMLANDKTD